MPKFQSKPVGNSCLHVGISPSSGVPPMKGTATATSHGAHVLEREKGASTGLFTLFLLLRNTCRATKTWMVWAVKCQVHTEAVLAKPKGGFGFDRVIVRKSDYDDNYLGSSPNSTAPAKLGSLAGHWSHVQLWINHCFLRWLMSKIGRPLAHYKGEIRKITLLDVLAPWQQDCTSTRRW